MLFSVNNAFRIFFLGWPMRIIWNPNEQRFEAQFSAGEYWSSDQTAAQDVVFHTDGPPAWLWFTSKATPLVKLRSNRPASGLSITADALAAFNHLQEIEQRNAQIKAALKEAQKAQTKVQREYEREEQIGDFEPPVYWQGKTSISRDDLPADILVRSLRHELIPQSRAVPTNACVICGDPIYFYELQEPPTCLSCEKGTDEFLDSVL